MCGRQTRRVIRAFLDATCAGDPWVLANIDPDRVVDRIADYVTHVPPLYRRLFFMTLWCFEYITFPFVPKFRPFSKLNLEDKIYVLDNWVTSWSYSKRIFVKLLTGVTVTCLYSEPKLLSAIGFDEALRARRTHIQ